ncbi:MAG: hypothetical protein J6Q47_04875 [Paludibacteraceae bacterium]|nr:hypothetical protein [Paludibacteraceae bacterium]
MKNLIRKVSFVIVGLVFLLSGIGKLTNIVGFQYLIIQYGFPILHFTAPFVVIFEVVLGIFLLLQVREKQVSLLSFFTILIFTGIFAYAHIENGVADCGCFGQISFLNKKPLFSYVRNVLLLIVLLGLYLTADEDKKEYPKWKYIIFYTILFSTCFLSGMSYKPFAFSERKHSFVSQHILENEMSRFVQEDGKSKIVFFFSYHCPHCLNSLENYKSFIEYEIVDTMMAYALVSSKEDGDTATLTFNSYYADLNIVEIERDSAGFVEVFPTSFYIKNDTIQDVIIGQLPSPLLFSK